MATIQSAGTRLIKKTGSARDVLSKTAFTGYSRVKSAALEGLELASVASRGSTIPSDSPKPMKGKRLQQELATTVEEETGEARRTATLARPKKIASFRRKSGSSSRTKKKRRTSAAMMHLRAMTWKQMSIQGETGGKPGVLGG